MAVAAAARALPRLMVVYQDMKLLRYIDNDDSHLPQGFLRFGDDKDGNFGSLYARFLVEETDNVESTGQVHIRNCYHNKYLARQSDNTNWIVAVGDEREDDITKWSCTLFEPVFVDPSGDDPQQKAYFRHIHSGCYLCLWSNKDGTDPLHDSCLALETSTLHDPLDLDILKVIDWQSVVILPKRIMLKGDNNLYLRNYEENDGSWSFKFDADSAKNGQASLTYETFLGPQGYTYIKSIANNKFWYANPPLISSTQIITADQDYNEDELQPAKLFWPVRLGDNVVALRCMENQCFCERVYYKDQNTVVTFSHAVDDYARMVVEEPVQSRIIENVSFRTDGARTYGDKVLQVISGKIINNPTEETLTEQLTFRYSDKRTSTWNASASFTVGIKTTISTGIPFLAEGKIEISAEFSGAYGWGETKETEMTLESTVTVNVPPKKGTKVTVIVRQGSCDIPFSYTQRDTLYNGEQRTYTMHDGIYTCNNAFNFDAIADPI